MSQASFFATPCNTRTSNLGGGRPQAMYSSEVDAAYETFHLAAETIFVHI